MPEKDKQGWARPDNNRKFHYFVNGMSLCNRWMYFGECLEDEYDDHKENCRACVAKVKLRRKAQGENNA